MSMNDQRKRGRLKKFFRSPLNVLTYGSVAVMGVFLCSFKIWAGSRSGVGWRAPAYYIAEASRSLESLAIMLAYLGVIVLLVFVVESQARNFIMLARRKGGGHASPGDDSVWNVLRREGRVIGEAFLFMAPAFLSMFLMSFVLGEMNSIDRVRLVDAALLGVEHASLGGYAFVMLGSVAYPALLINFIIFSFKNLVGILVLSAFLLAYVNMRLMRELVAAFCFCAVLMVPLWIAFPALSPQDRFVDNVYHLPVPSAVAAVVSARHVEPQIAAFLAGIRTEKNGLADMPTSTMPSAHAAWAVLAGYYLFRAKKWLGWIALLFLLASTAGTVILAQHYALDVLVGILIATLAIGATSSLTSRQPATEVF
jgi:membrane-associated phospholipid phosphatase